MCRSWSTSEVKSSRPPTGEQSRSRTDPSLINRCRLPFPLASSGTQDSRHREYVFLCFAGGTYFSHCCYTIKICFDGTGFPGFQSTSQFNSLEAFLGKLNKTTQACVWPPGSHGSPAFMLRGKGRPPIDTSSPVPGWAPGCSGQLMLLPVILSSPGAATSYELLSEHLTFP